MRDELTGRSNCSCGGGCHRGHGLNGCDSNNVLGYVATSGYGQAHFRLFCLDCAKPMVEDGRFQPCVDMD